MQTLLRVRRASVYCLLSALLLIALPAMAQAPGMSLNVQGKRLTVSGASPGTSVVFIGAALSRLSYHSKLSRIEKIVPDEDRDGTVSFESELTSRSILVAVDLRTGEYVLRNPDGGTAPTISFPSTGFRVGGTQGQRVSLELSGPTIEMYVIRPALGVWRTTAHQGGHGDEDQANNGVIVVSASSAKSLEGSAPSPASFLPLDVVIGIDTLNMNIFAGRIQ